MEIVPSVSHRHDNQPRFEGQRWHGAVPCGTATELLPQRLITVVGGGGASNCSPTTMKDEVAVKSEGSAAGAWEERCVREAAGSGASEGGGGPGEGTAGLGAGAGGEHAGPAPETSQLDPRAPVRKGKWTPEEEMYTTRIINDFNKGLLPLAPGTTLRSYLSEKLNCDPMRITKKFAGASCIGKRVFMPAERTPENLIETHRSRQDLEEMARKFHNRLESMRPGAAGKSSGSGGSSKGGAGSISAQTSPKPRRSSMGGGGAPLGCGGICAVSATGSHFSRRGELSAGSGARSATRGGDGCGFGSGASSSRSPSPGAHGPHSACDDSAPHPEGSPGRRSSSWEREEEGGYGQYDPMDRSPSGDSEDESGRHHYCSSSSGSASYAGGRGSGYGDYDRGNYAHCPDDSSHGGDEGLADYGRIRGIHQQQQLKTAPGRHHVSEGFHGHGARRSYNFHVGVGGEGKGMTDTGQQSRRRDVAESAANNQPTRLSPMSRGGGNRGASWGGLLASASSSSAGKALGNEPRTLPPATVMRESLGVGGGSGARSPTWPLPKVIPEGSEISDQDAGGLLMGFFRSVHEKVQTGSEELGESISKANEQQGQEQKPKQQQQQQGESGMHPLIATKRGFRSISSPALTQFAHYAEQLPRLQTPPFKRRKSVSSFV